jgi:hypothetical protein
MTDQTNYSTDWHRSKTQPRRSCYVDLRSLAQAQQLWAETTTAVAAGMQPPVIRHKGRNWWVTSYEVRGPRVRVRLHEAIEVVYVQESRS